jgi:K+-sensing histidine kinase KdpD
MGGDYDEKVKPRDQGMTARVLKLGTHCAVSKPGEAPGINGLAAARGVEAILGLPMKIQDEIIGILFVHYSKPHEFSKSEINMLSLFANQAALAIENRRLLDELKTQYRLRARQEALKITSRMVAHRLRNVLPIISDRISRTLERGAVTGDGVEWCRMALKESCRAQTIIRDFETFSRTGMYELPDRLSGFELVQRLGQIVKDALTQADAQVFTTGNADLPLAQVNLHVLSYDFANFVNDSQRHKPNGLCVNLSCDLAREDEVRRAGVRGGGRYFKLSYADNGPGISYNLKRQIFEAFFTTSNGSGLGLAIASYNAAIHGGAIIECGQPRHGVRFELYLPVASSSRKGERS